MKKIVIMTASLLFAVSSESFAQAFNNVWVKADVYPAGSGKVFIDDYQEPETFKYDSSSEFKRTSNSTPSAAFIWTKPAEGYLFAGIARDTNHDGQYNNDFDVDRLIHVWANHFFTCFYDHTNYEVSGSSSQSMDLALEALEQMTTPTDQVFAVFTQGAVARRAEGQESRGYVYANKLFNMPGEQVTFYAYGDSEYISGEGNIYYKFDHWTDAAGNTVSTDREFTVTVTGMEIYYAYFVETTKEDNKENEQRPDRFKFDYNNPDWNPAGIQEVANGKVSDGQCYDLQGRRVAQPTKGIFIQNGKKAVFK